jgi:hypothetical protein
LNICTSNSPTSASPKPLCVIEHTETYDKERANGTISFEEQSLNDKTELQPEEKQDEIKVEEQVDNSNIQQDWNTKVILNTAIKYQKIIETLLNNQAEVKLTEIKNKIKNQFNETKTVDEIWEIIKSLKIEAETVIGKSNTIKKL